MTLLYVGLALLAAVVVAVVLSRDWSGDRTPGFVFASVGLLLLVPIALVVGFVELVGIVLATMKIAGVEPVASSWSWSTIVLMILAPLGVGFVLRIIQHATE